MAVSTYFDRQHTAELRPLPLYFRLLRRWEITRVETAARLLRPGDKALEVGCGLGLAGIAALKRGLRVTFTDIDELAVRFATDNARLNGFTDFETGAIDLRSPPAGLQVPVLLGADLLYEPRMIEPVVAFIAAALAPGGVCLLADPDRISARPFQSQCQNAELHVEAAFARAGQPGGERTKGTVYRISRLPAEDQARPGHQ